MDDVVGNSDDHVLGSFSYNGAVVSGASYTRSESVSLPFDMVGAYSLFVVTDSGQRVYESSDGNNASPTSAIDISRETPDLQVEIVEIPSAATAGDAVVVNWIVRNDGSNRTNSNYCRTYALTLLEN